VRTAARTADANPTRAHLPRDRPAGSTVSADQASRAPVIVLAPAYSGASTLRSVLAGHPDLACTSGTGVLPLCEQAMATWRHADGRPTGTPSSLASTATRVLVSSVITSILARARKPRWCEVAAANPQAAETFLRLYPGTRFLCLHRACPGVIRAALDASPWGITDPAFAPFTIKYPASTVASLTAYWVTATGPLLAFEREYPQSCLRVRVEDLARGRQAEERITSFLGLADTVGPPILGEPQSAPPDPELAAGLPVNLIPPALLAQANDLLQQLGYPPMAASQELRPAIKEPAQSAFRIPCLRGDRHDPIVSRPPPVLQPCTHGLALNHAAVPVLTAGSSGRAGGAEHGSVRDDPDFGFAL